ncbi:CatB-related O-acetyltransferase [Neorhizobium sp. AL 9.2.2]|uniref:CatB-related O-acetyltransferase n=1 Tax=Neorhizobium sp. AL 9.2.2 TaxID=2712894 RepID=UPI001574608C|nr:CatB-related O-acetyltransferase [Neorhizobium sp. AL 9.2.2]NSY19772.1 CatB-related O-acetyltransferase [Neorhizobium sp. AL 9.2.2]
MKEFNVSLPPLSTFQLRRATRFEENVVIASKTIVMIRSFGSFSYLGRGCEIYSTESVGRYCSFGQEILAGAGPHPTNWLSTSTFFYRKKMFAGHPEVDEFYSGEQPAFTTDSRQIKIGNDVWIGSRAIILSGVSIGHGAVIAAGAIVTKDVDPYCIVAGVPAKPIRKRFNDPTVDRLLESGWWDVKPSSLKGLDFTDVEKTLDEIDRIKQTQGWEYKPKLLTLGPT